MSTVRTDRDGRDTALSDEDNCRSKGDLVPLKVACLDDAEELLVKDVHLRHLSAIERIVDRRTVPSKAGFESGEFPWRGRIKSDPSKRVAVLWD